MKVIRMSYLRTCYLYHPFPQEIFRVLIFVREWFDSRAGRIISMKNSNETIGNRAPRSKFLPLKIFLTLYIGSGNFGKVTLIYVLPSIYRAHRSFCKYTSPEQSKTVLTLSRNIYKIFGAIHRSIFARIRFRIFSLWRILHISKLVWYDNVFDLLRITSW